MTDETYRVGERLRVTDQAWIDHKRQQRMSMVDDMTPEFRALVHEYGLSVVMACTQCGVTKAKHIRHVVETVLDEFSPTRGSFSAQGITTPHIEKAAK